MSASTVDAALRAGAAQLTDAGVPDAPSDARRLMAAALGVPPDRLVLAGRDAMPDDAVAQFRDFVLRRCAREPVSHIIGGRWFYGRWFTVTRDVLDPRPETETLVEQSLAVPFSKVLDLGTGSGAILVTLLAERPEASGVGTDIDDRAVLVAGENAERYGVTSRLILPVSDWYDDVGGRFDLIVSNPPYIAAAEMADLAPEVRDWEPRGALTDGGDGLSAYRAIAGGARDHLTPDGRLLVEIGPTQASAVTALFSAAGLDDIAVHPDLDGRPRVVAARAPRARDR